MSVTLMNGVVLSGSDQASSALLVSAGQVQLFFTIVVTVGTVSVNWYLEYTDDAPVSGTWYREVAEEDAGAGVVSMPKVVRTLADNSGTTLAVGTHNIAAPFVRPGPLVRAQVSVTGAGTAVCTIKSPSGALAA